MKLRETLRVITLFGGVDDLFWILGKEIWIRGAGESCDAVSADFAECHGSGAIVYSFSGFGTGGSATLCSCGAAAG